ncbi:MAG TPA: hypothetical protein VE972_01845 [Conexibacter sp.]|nr:hypothetical protein [Conexibacter sp.]
MPRRNGTWELRESSATSAGPRSRTLATFRVLTPDVLGHARARAGHSFDETAVRHAARRVGAPIAPPVADAAAGDLLAELAAGRAPRSALRRLLQDALGAEGGEPTDTARAAGAWVSASSQQRGEALWDLLLLADHLPAPRTLGRDRPRFPRIRSEAA